MDIGNIEPPSFNADDDEDDEDDFGKNRKAAKAGISNAQVNDWDQNEDKNGSEDDSDPDLVAIPMNSEAFMAKVFGSQGPK